MNLSDSLLPGPNQTTTEAFKFNLKNKSKEKDEGEAYHGFHFLPAFDLVTNYRLTQLLLSLLLILLPFLLPAQIIWQENFSTYPNGTLNSANWTTNFNDCDDVDVNMGNNFWGVFNGEFRVNDIEGFNCMGGGTNIWGDNQNTLTTSSITISAHACVDLSVDIRSVGGFQCTSPVPVNTTPAVNNGHDQAVIEYSLNGGGWNQFATNGYICGDDNLPATATQTNLSGNTVRIRIRLGNVANSETYYLDDIVVEATSTTPALTAIGPFCSSDPSTPLATTQSGITGSWSGNGVIGGNSFNPSTASVGPNTLTFTPNPGQCANTNTTSVTVNAGPDVNDIANQTACGSYILPAISGVNLSGAQAFYTASGGGGVQLLPGQAITTAATTTIFIYDSNGSCSDEEQFNVTITPAPTVNDLANQSICGAYTLPAITGSNLSGGEAYYTLSGGNGTSFSAGQSITSTTTLFIYDGSGSCSDEEQVIITILPPPIVDDLANASACGSYTLPVITGTNLSGSAAYYTQSGGNGTSFNPGQNITSTTTLFIYDGTGACSDEEQVTITITSPPIVNDLANTSSCNSFTLPPITGINLTGGQAYYTQSGGNGTSFSPGQNITSTTTLFIYDGTAGCDDEEQVTITITSAPTVNDIANVSACQSYTLPAITGTNLTGGQAYYAQSGGNGTSFSPGQAITSTTTLFIYDGVSGCDDEEQFTITINQAPTVNDIPNQTACNSYTLPAITGTNLSGGQAYYTSSGGNGNSFSPGQTITTTTTLFIYDGVGGCDDQEQFTITITSAPNVLDFANQTACGSFTLPNISGSNLTGNQAYYTGPNSTGTQFNIGQQITASISLFVYDGSPGCSDQEQFSITITPAPDIDFQPTQNVCGSFVLPAITGSNLSGAQAYYTGTSGSGTRYNPGDVIMNSITLFMYDGGGSCEDQEIFSVNISPQPDITDITDLSTCGSFTLPNITGTNLTGNEAYFSASGGNGISFNPGEVISTTTTLFIYDGIAGCEDEEQFTITITTQADVNDLADVTACGSFTLPNISGTNLTGNEAYFSATGGSGTSFNPGQVISATTTLFIYDGTTGCEDEEQFTITITPLPDIDDINDVTDCGSFTLPNISGTNLTGNEAYFSASGGNGTSFNPGQVISTTTTLFIYDGTTGCEDEEQFTITITPLPDVNDLADVTACGSFTLPNISGTNLTGNEAYFSATGGSGTSFNPGQVISTTTTLFIYDGTTGCEDEEQFTITITPLPDVNDLADVTACASFTLPNITGTNLTGNEAYFSASGGNGTSFNPGQVISTTTTLFIYDGTTGCEDEEQFTITITPLPDVNDLADVTACGSFTLPNITGTNLTGNEAYFSASGGNGTSFNPGQVISTTTTLFIYDGIAGCEDEEQFIITITPQPEVNDLADVTACGSFTLPNISGINLTGNEAYFSATGGNGTSFNPGQVISTTTTLFIYDGTTACEDEEQFTITITPQPDVNDLADVTACGSFTLPNISGTNLTGNEAYFSATGGSGTSFNPGQVISTTTTLFIYDGTTGCEDEEQFTITITPLPDVNDLADVTACGSFTLPNISGTNLTGNEAYFSASGGNGTSFNPGEVISTTTTLFIYDGIAGCEDEEQFTITITTQADVNDLTDVTACGSFTLPNISGTNLTGNEAYFSATGGSGTSFNPGQVISTTTTLFIYDGIAGCEDEEQFTITITTQPDVNDLTDVTACGSFTLPNISGTNLTGNEAYFSATGGSGTSFNPGQVISTTTTLFIYDGTTGCEDEEQFTITITPQPDVNDLADVTACGSFTLPNISGTNLTGNEAYFSAAGGSGTSFNSGQVISATTTLFIYDGTTGCEDEEQFTITITPQPDVNGLADVTACGSFTLPNISGTNLTGNEAYFSAAGGNGTSFNPGQVISTTTTLFIYDGTTACEDEEQFTITITPQPDVNDLADVTACGSFTLPNISGTNLTGNEAYFSATGGSGTSFNPGQVISATTTLFIYDGTTACEDEEQFTITITPQPDIDDINDVTDCGSFTLPNITGTNLTGNEAYFSAAGGSGTSFNLGQVISTTTTLFIYDGTTGCEDEEQFIITITPQPDIDDINDVTDCGSFTLPNITGTNLSGNEAYFSAAGGNGTRLNPGEVITTTTTLFIYDGSPGCEDEEQFTITIPEQPDLDALTNQSACGIFTLPAITGSNLTGNQAYFTETNGQGTRFLPGEEITQTTTLFIYDGASGCEDEEVFTVSIIPSPVLDPVDEQTACSSFTLPPITGNNLSGNEAYFSLSGGNGIRLNPGDEISNTSTLFIFDMMGNCESEVQFTINILPQPQIDDIPDQISCESFVLPAITGVNLSGNEAYFSGPNGTGTSFQEGQTITDGQVFFIWDMSNGCNSQQVFEVIIHPNPDVLLLPTAIACAGDEIGQINTNVIAGTGPFTYDWNFDQYDDLANLTNIGAGTYSLTLSDANSCNVVASIQLNEPEPLTLSCEESAPVSTIGGNDGAAAITLSGGTGPYTLDWENGGITGSQTEAGAGNTTIDLLAVGNYSLVLTDANNCNSSCTFTVTDPACRLSISTAAQEVSCNDAEDGTISLTLTDGQGPFSFTWNDPNLNGIQNPEDLPAGDYMVTVVDDNACEAVGSATIVAPPPLSLTGLSTTPISTIGANDGGVSVNYQGGTAPYRISWAGPIFGSLASPSSGVFAIDVFPPGDYTLTVEDEQGCTEVIDFTIPGVNCSLSIEVTGNDLSCFEDQSGRIQLTINGGISPMTIDWNVDSLDGLRTLQELAAGDYQVLITDANGCQATDSISLAEPAPLSLICTPVQVVSAPGASDGAVTIEVTGGVPNYTVDWTNGVIDGSENLFIPGTITIDNLNAGDYNIFLFDNNSCMATCGLTVEEDCPATTSLLNTTLCSGDSIQVNGNFYHQGNPSGVEVLLNANSLGCDSTVTIDLQFFEAAVATVNQDVCRGESIQIGNTTFDENNTSGQVIIPNASPDGCDSIITVTINLLDAPVFFLEGATTICRGEAATLTFRASNYSEPVGINIISDNGETLALTDMVDGSTFTVNPEQTSTYSITSTDGGSVSCPIVLQGEVVISISGPEVNLVTEDYNGFQLSCANANDGVITVQIEGGVPPFNYQWSNGQQTDRLTNLTEGLYEVTVTDNLGCEGFGEALLSAPTEIVADIVPISPGCNGAEGQIRIDNISGGVGPYEVSLDGAAYASISSLPFVLNALEPGNYQLNFRGVNGCESSVDTQIANEDPLLLDLGEDLKIKFGESITITALTNFDATQIEWTPTDSITIISTNEISVSPTRTTVYTAQAFDAAGCSISDEITIAVDRGIDLFRPTVFSPNNDGVNDVFQVFAGPAITAINVFQVYDRWGNILYDVKTVAPNDPSVGWDGTYRGQAMNAGVYVYFLEVTLIDGRTEVFKGDVALLR